MDVTLHRMFELAAPREAHTRAARDRQSGSAASLPPRRRAGLLSVAALRRAFFASSSPEARTAIAGDEASSLRAALDALGRVHRRVVS